MKSVIDMTEAEFAAAYPCVNKARITMGLTFRQYRYRFAAQFGLNMVATDSTGERGGSMPERSKSSGVEQMVAHQPHKLEVAGSSPVPATTLYRRRSGWGPCCLI